MSGEIMKLQEKIWLLEKQRAVELNKVSNNYYTNMSFVASLVEKLSFASDEQFITHGFYKSSLNFCIMETRCQF